MYNNLRSIEEIPETYRKVFTNYPCFNAFQSVLFHEALSTDNSLVVSAPTGSGKTAIFEMAIVRFLMQRENDPEIAKKKIVYISPIKALCTERLTDWHKKFSNYNMTTISLTGDSEDIDIKSIMQFDIIISTPEKWDIITRKWKQNQTVVTSIVLFLIDEVHLLNAESRGPTLEVIVSRMKLAAAALSFNNRNIGSIRFVALSATIPNIEDIAEWIGPKENVKYFKFSEDIRPVKINKVVLGYAYHTQRQSVFRFDMSLTYKLPALIKQYSEGKPTLIFCNTRKSVEMTAAHLVTGLQISLSSEQKQSLLKVEEQLKDPKLKRHVSSGIAFHHAGLIYENRHVVEDAFKKGLIPVLVTTSTLAMGVNLPAHMVIIKCTKQYHDGGYKDYDEIAIFQMIGRAGRSQFDQTATALILTSLQDKEKYTEMLNCNQTIDSNLHKHLTEHLNAEVVLHTITDLDVAMRWLSSTFLYVRALKSPEKYKLPPELSKDKLDKKLIEMCQIDLIKLQKAGMIKLSEDIEIRPTIVGRIMAKYYVAYETMKLFTEINGQEVLIQILAIICKSKEFSEIYLRTNDKKCLNLLNKNSKKEAIRFPLSGRIKTSDMKVNVIIQAVLGNLEIDDQSVLCDSLRVMRNCVRLANCFKEYLETRDSCYNALLNTIILVKCFQARLWENSPYVSKQLTGVGQVMSTLLRKANKTCFKDIAESNPRNIEMLINRKPPFGNNLVDEAKHLPEYKVELVRNGETLDLCITLTNREKIEEKSTIDINSMMSLLVGDSSNNILLYEKYAHTYMLDSSEVRRSVKILDMEVEYICANFISESFVGIDCTSSLQISTKSKPALDSNVKKGQQTYIDMYMCSVKKPTMKKKIASKEKVSKTGSQPTASQPAKLVEDSVSEMASAPDGQFAKEDSVSVDSSKVECVQSAKDNSSADVEPKIIIQSVHTILPENSTENTVPPSTTINDIQPNSFTNKLNWFNSEPYENLVEKYGYGQIQTQHPDSTAEKQRRGSVSSYMDERKRTNSAFEIYQPTKSITWRSPLVHTPTNAPFSPVFAGSAMNSHRGSDKNQQTENQDLSISSLSFDNVQSTRKRHNLAADNPSKKSRYQFPLSDPECQPNHNQSFIENVNVLEDVISSPEHIGLSTHPKKASAKYYNFLINESKTSKSSDVENTSLTVNKKSQSQSETSSDLFSELDMMSPTKSNFFNTAASPRFHNNVSHQLDTPRRYPPMDYTPMPYGGSQQPERGGGGGGGCSQMIPPYYPRRPPLREHPYNPYPIPNYHHQCYHPYYHPPSEPYWHNQSYHVADDIPDPYLDTRRFEDDNINFIPQADFRPTCHRNFFHTQQVTPARRSHFDNNNPRSQIYDEPTRLQYLRHTFSKEKPKQVKKFSLDHNQSQIRMRNHPPTHTIVSSTPTTNQFEESLDNMIMPQPYSGYAGPNELRRTYMGERYYEN